MTQQETDLVKFEGRVSGEENLPATTPENTPAALIQMAISNKADLDKLEKLMALQERYEANEAKKAYVEAMANFKANPPEINKDKRVSYPTGKGQTEYSHATLANVTEKINAALSKHRLSAAWTTHQENGTISVTCKITHVMGHSEETTLTASPDNSGSKNPIQAIGSTVSYLERYTVLALTGLASKDMDDDVKTGGTVVISEKQLSQLVDMINETETNLDKFLKLGGVEKLDLLPAEKFDTAMAWLKAKLEDKRKGK